MHSAEWIVFLQSSQGLTELAREVTSDPVALANRFRAQRIGECVAVRRADLGLHSTAELEQRRNLFDPQHQRTHQDSIELLKSVRTAHVRASIGQMREARGCLAVSEDTEGAA